MFIDPSMFNLETSPDDEGGFVDLASRLVAGAAVVHGLSDVLIYKIDNWFGHKWLGFSGKTLGALGVWARPLTLPPFVSNRVVRGWGFRRDADGGYREMGPPPYIHDRIRSAANLRRRVGDIVPTSALAWFSGNSARTGRGSLMAYLPVAGQEPWPWYVALAKDGEWKITRRKGIHPFEIRSFEGAVEKFGEAIKE